MGGKMEGDDLLREAILRNSALVLSLPSGGMVRHYKSRFLSESTVDGAFVIESVPEERPLIDACIDGGSLAGISFKSGDEKVVFATKIVRREPGFALSKDVAVEALHLLRPREVKSIQRRSNYRVRVTRLCDLSVRVWRLNQRAFLNDKPLPSQEVAATLLDLSCGGVGVIFDGEGKDTPKISSDDRLRVELTYRTDKQLVIEGRLRPGPIHKLDGARMRTGIHFKQLQNDLDGRMVATQLTQIVGELQREEVRRMRLGLMSA